MPLLFRVNQIMTPLRTTDDPRWARRRTSTGRSDVAWSSPRNEWIPLQTVRSETISITGSKSLVQCCCVWVYLCDEEGGRNVWWLAGTFPVPHQTRRRGPLNECVCEKDDVPNQGSHATIIFRYQFLGVCHRNLWRTQCWHQKLRERERKKQR